MWNSRSRLFLSRRGRLLHINLAIPLQTKELLGDC
jgi:hypothetical protein